jgi:hypothetical protein
MCTRFPFLALELEARKRPDAAILPEALRRPVTATTAGAASATDGGSGRKRQAANANDGGRPRVQGPHATPGDLSVHLNPMLAAAKLRTTSTLKIKDIFPDDQTTARILGAEFMSLVPAGRHPCLRHHVYGTCTGICNRSHDLRARPSPALLVAIASRVQTQLDVIIQQHPN